MRLPRMTTRRLMAAVAYLAIPLAFLIAMDRRVTRFVRAAEYHKEQVALLGRLGREEHLGGGSVRGIAPPPKAIRAREYHSRMAENYRHAARYPWLPVEPDPPEPK
jgi:hypothetical protein